MAYNTAAYATAKNDTLDAFNNVPRYAFEDELGRGQSGVALLFRDSTVGRTAKRPERFCVKAMVGVTQPDLEIENNRLFRLRWAKHIIGLLKINPDPTKADGNFIILAHITEYIPHGTLNRFAARWQQWETVPGQLPPNRILWPIFLCFRAVVAMAYPPGNSTGSQRWPYETLLERVPSGPHNITPGVLSQGDMQSLDNWVFGEIEQARRETRTDAPGEGVEHSTLPIIKLIDYGQATEFEEPEPGTSDIDDNVLPQDIANFDGALGLPAITAAEQGAPTIDPRARNEAIEENIRAIGETMMNLIGANRGHFARTQFRDLVGNLLATPPNNREVDLDLLMLVARCMAVDRRNRPNLAHLLHVVQYEATRRDGLFYRRPRERDEYIRRVVQACILEP
ncbi:hypothetical protein F5Y18DRAFT_435047 [Xylariaceae sp. FL1019]|nr:hypothetical protein F5Y18DRAFT_435047 [Xylariaceae sp. FL1019]